MAKLFLFLGSINAFIAVALGALGAHGLKDKLSERAFEVFQTGARYHIIHALGLILIGLISQWISRELLVQWAGWFFLLGITLFSGSLYFLALLDLGWLGILTPLGGLAFLAGWLVLAIAALKIP